MTDPQEQLADIENHLAYLPPDVAAQSRDELTKGLAEFLELIHARIAHAVLAARRERREQN